MFLKVDAAIRFKMDKQKGFTLLEILVVIAIIAVLVSIVLVAIDPVRRINDSYDRVAASNVRATGTLISVCVAKRLSESPPESVEGCASPAMGFAIINSYGTKPADVSLAVGNSIPDDDVCSAQQGSLPHYYVFKHSEGQVFEIDGELSLVDPMLWCPGLGL